MVEEKGKALWLTPEAGRPRGRERMIRTTAEKKEVRRRIRREQTPVILQERNKMRAFSGAGRTSGEISVKS